MTKPITNQQQDAEHQTDPARATPITNLVASAADQARGAGTPAAVHASPEMLPSVARIERYVRERRDTDRPLIGWGVYFFLLTWLTLGIYPIVVFYKRLQRADLFSERRQHYYGAVISFTTEYAEQTGQTDAVHDDTDDLAAYVKERFANVHQPIKAGMSVALSFLTLGIYGLIAYYRAMKFWWEVQITEQDFCERLSLIWARLGLIRYPVRFDLMQQLRRSFWMNFFLSIVTLGIYGIVWDHQLHTDPDKVYPEFHSTEDAVLNAARTVHA